jgi:hypothetical protein
MSPSRFRRRGRYFVAHGLDIALGDGLAAQEIEKIIGGLPSFQRSDHVVYEG